MSYNLGNTDAITYDGKDVEKLTLDGTTIWEKPDDHVMLAGVDGMYEEYLLDGYIFKFNGTYPVWPGGVTETIERHFLFFHHFRFTREAGYYKTNGHNIVFLGNFIEGDWNAATKTFTPAIETAPQRAPKMREGWSKVSTNYSPGRRYTPPMALDYNRFTLNITINVYSDNVYIPTLSIPTTCVGPESSTPASYDKKLPVPETLTVSQGTFGSSPGPEGPGGQVDETGDAGFEGTMERVYSTDIFDITITEIPTFGGAGATGITKGKFSEIAAATESSAVKVYSTTTTHTGEATYLYRNPAQIPGDLRNYTDA